LPVGVYAHSRAHSQFATDQSGGKEFRVDIGHGRQQVWKRGAPQSGFSTLIRRINPRSSVSICGRPPCGRDFQRQ
jgi:hypothetical protein